MNPDSHSLNTYPARPRSCGVVNGNVWRSRPPYKPKLYTPKYNGWRVALHVPSGRCFNRHNRPLSIEDEFGPAISYIQDRKNTLAEAGDALEWLDCEGLERRHGIGRGSLIVLDSFSCKGASYEDRACVLTMAFSTHDIYKKPKANAVLTPVRFSRANAPCVDETLLSMNKEWGVEFYEGMVGVDIDSPYPRQTQSSSKVSPTWCKHRWEAQDVANN